MCQVLWEHISMAPGSKDPYFKHLLIYNSICLIYNRYLLLSITNWKWAHCIYSLRFTDLAFKYHYMITIGHALRKNYSCTNYIQWLFMHYNIHAFMHYAFMHLCITIHYTVSLRASWRLAKFWGWQTMRHGVMPRVKLKYLN